MTYRSRFQVQVFGLWQLATNWAAAGSQVAWLAEMLEADTGMWSAEYLESAEKLQIFRRRYIVGILTNKANIGI